ncbi:lysozyme inhibitor LprI family protein [Methylomonas methanica]|uniref:Lysozyme inhibitor LprI-like N-terminal domain-containing protein n=1 Tax=Methylomonas methanica (strain DSM 25384 / MC09) TaxID=857087 RepID=G0A2U3_METMM|nr:lysozyme inhibitor LprI family protein [Methylomonas methanica]AEG01446.1 protein of unknown function DUF1311 [Methylomonas methanica MC09]
MPILEPLNTRETRKAERSLPPRLYDFRFPIKPVMLSLILACPPAIADDAKQSCLDNANTQREINQCSGLENESADRELNRVYQAILKQHAGDKLFIDSLKQAQRAWLKWRDAEMLAIYPASKEPGYYGSSFAGCWSDQLATMTHERTRQLKKWLDGVEEGDICAGSLPIKSSQPALPENLTAP